MRITDETQIDLNRAIIDPEYRRAVIAFLNDQNRAPREKEPAAEPTPAVVPARVPARAA